MYMLLILVIVLVVVGAAVALMRGSDSQLQSQVAAPPSNMDPSKLTDPWSALRPRFMTPGRQARHQALIAQVSAQTGMAPEDIQMPVPVTIDVAGLAMPVAFVLDMGTHVASVSELEIGGSATTTEEMLKRGIANLDANTSFRLPTPGEPVVELVDPDDHGAALVLCLAERLAEGQSLLAVGPSHGTLVLFQEDANAGRTAQEKFTRKFESDGRDAPIPEPVRITRSGIEPAAWPS